MPIHLAACTKCDIDWEVLTLSIRDAVDLTCPKCKKKGERRFGVPLLKTNATFLRGAKYGAEQFASDGDHSRNQYLEPAKRAGVSVNGKIYQHGLARYPGDPEAWCSDLDDVKRKIRKRGLHCPELGIKGRDVEPKESAAIAEDILNDKIESMIESGTLRKSELTEDKRGEIADSISHPSKKGKYKRPKRVKSR